MDGDIDNCHGLFLAPSLLTVVNINVTENPKSDNDKNKMTFKEALMGVNK